MLQKCKTECYLSSIHIQNPKDDSLNILLYLLFYKFKSTCNIYVYKYINTRVHIAL